MDGPRAGCPVVDDCAPLSRYLACGPWVCSARSAQRPGRDSSFPTLRGRRYGSRVHLQCHARGDPADVHEVGRYADIQSPSVAICRTTIDGLKGPEVLHRMSDRSALAVHGAVLPQLSRVEACRADCRTMFPRCEQTALTRPAAVPIWTARGRPDDRGPPLGGSRKVRAPCRHGAG